MNKKDKLPAYLGFCARAGQIRKGYNTCLSLIDSGKVKLLIVAEDCSENTKKKFSQKCRSSGTDFRIFGQAENLSRMTGCGKNGVYAVMDRNFANVIRVEIDRKQSEGVVVNDKEGN
ncbi:MAG: L7Ae/L30e/S12e/Gadd45 family ribosomal protein [Eubacteriales bacterium]|nr:L7Ae/L30e/S12e/Gadd45 family ribosomal protein [Eubacteriales bacterium]